MRTTAIHHSSTARVTTPRTPVQPPAHGPSWWPAARQQALRSTRMLSLALLLGLAGWTLVLLAVLLWFAWT